MKFGKTEINRLTLPVVTDPTINGSNAITINGSCILNFVSTSGTVDTITGSGDYVIFRISSGSGLVIRSGFDNIYTLTNANLNIYANDAAMFFYDSFSSKWFQMGRQYGTELNGAQGDVGASGDSGDPGDPGEAGADSLVPGTQGGAGDPGDPGGPGAQGAQGATGDPGNP
jgi:hypothetical protein